MLIKAGRLGRLLFVIRVPFRPSGVGELSRRFELAHNPRYLKCESYPKRAVFNLGGTA